MFQKYYNFLNVLYAKYLYLLCRYTVIIHICKCFTKNHHTPRLPIFLLFLPRFYMDFTNLYRCHLLYYVNTTNFK